MATDEDLEECFAENLESYEDYKESIQTLYAYQKYFSEEQLENALQIILNVAEECDEDMDELEELIEDLKSEIDVETDDDEEYDD